MRLAQPITVSPPQANAISGAEDTMQIDRVPE